MVIPRVFGIASGKGGVGKTTLAVNIAVSLADAGHSTLLLDGDLGLANSQILLGVPPQLTISQALSGQRPIDEVALEVMPNLDLIAGTSGNRLMGSLNGVEVTAIIRTLSALTKPYEFMIVDIAAGISEAVITFLQACQYPLIAVRDEPAAIADAYGLIKVFSGDIPPRPVHLIANGMADHEAGELLHRQFNQVCERFLGQSVGLAGVVTHDEQIRISNKRKTPLVHMAPSSQSAKDIRQLAESLKRMPPMDAHGGTQFFLERLVRQRPAV